MSNGPYMNIRPAAEKAWMKYMNPFCQTDNVHLYRMLEIMEAQVDESGTLVGIETPFFGFACLGMEAANAECNLDDPSGPPVLAGKMQINIRTLAEDVVNTDGAKIEGGDVHDNLVGRVLDAIYQVTVDPDLRQSLPDVLNALATPGISLNAVFIPLQDYPRAIGATYESNIMVPFWAVASTINM